MKSDWYKVRDDRTDLIEGVKDSYKEFNIGVIVDEQSPSYSTQVMILITLNILARWCRNIWIDIPHFDFEVPSLKGKPSILGIKETLTSINPSLNLEFGEINEKEIFLIIGSSKKARGNHYWVQSSGWIAGCGYGKHELTLMKEDSNIIGSAFAACLINAELFRVANELSELQEFQDWYSLYDFEHENSPSRLSNPSIPSKIDLGIIHQIGCGAIGSSFDYLLGFCDWRINLSLIDFDKIEPHNCSSSLIFSFDQSDQNIKKIDACSEYLVKSGQQNSSYFMAYGDFLISQNSSPDVVLCFANENAVWSNIQNNYPPIVFHATTNKNWGTNFGRHIPIKEWCIMCRFEEEVESNFIPVCAEGEIVSKNDTIEEVLGILPFLSVMSSVITLAEVAKLGYPNYPINENFIEFSSKIRSGIFMKYQLGPKPCYVCRDQDPNIYKQILKGNKFDHLYV